MRPVWTLCLLSTVASAFTPTRTMLLDCIAREYAPTLDWTTFVSMDERLRRKRVLRTSMEKLGYHTPDDIWTDFATEPHTDSGYMDRTDLEAMVDRLSEGKSKTLVSKGIKIMYKQLCSSRVA